MRTLGVNSRLKPFGATIFAEMTALAVKHGAVNLGQGAPDFDGPEFLKEAAIKAIRDGRGQYARMTGLPELTKAIAERFHRRRRPRDGWPRRDLSTSRRVHLPDFTSSSSFRVTCRSAAPCGSTCCRNIPNDNIALLLRRSSNTFG